ncbi:hypothetical protein BH10PSE7_BH10PSE7_04370 [soil metagenome]
MKRTDRVRSLGINFFRLSAIAFAASFGMMAASQAFAQEELPAPPKNSFGPRLSQAAKPGPAPEVISTHGDWKVQCEGGAAQVSTGDAAPPAKQCGMVQTAHSEKNEKVALTLVMVKGKQNGKDVTMMRVVAPIGVFLPTGVALEVDGGAIGRVPFTRCLPQVCIAFAEASPQTLDKMRKGTFANFIIYEAPGLGMPMKISLNGFSAAFSALDKL